MGNITKHIFITQTGYSTFNVPNDFQSFVSIDTIGSGGNGNNTQAANDAYGSGGGGGGSFDSHGASALYGAGAAAFTGSQGLIVFTYYGTNTITIGPGITIPHGITFN